MGTKERHQRERDRIREAILAAARDLFVTEGYRNVSMRKIAERIEYSPTAIYLYFKDKPALIRELVAGDFRALAAQFSTIARVGDPIERLRQTGRAYIEFGLAHPSAYRTMFSAPPAAKSFQDEPDRGNPDRDGYAFLRGVVEEALAKGLLRPELTDPDLVAQVCWAGVHGVVSLLISRGQDDWAQWRDRSEIIELMLDALVRGVARPDAVVRKAKTRRRAR